MALWARSGERCIVSHAINPKALNETHLSLNEIHRRYGVALSTLRRKIKAGELVRIDGKGVTAASVRKLYGEPPEPPATGESDTPERGGSEGGALP